MARLVKHEDKGPTEVKVGGESKWLCRCGLSATQPYCNGTHKTTQDEEAGKLYAYKDGKRVEI